MEDTSNDVRYFCVREEKLLEHLLLSEAQVHAGRHHLLQEPLDRRLRLSAVLSANHFGLVVRSKHQGESFCVESQLKHQHLSAFPQFILQTRKEEDEGGRAVTCSFMSEWKITTLSDE